MSAFALSDELYWAVVDDDIGCVRRLLGFTDDCDATDSNQADAMHSPPGTEQLAKFSSSSQAVAAVDVNAYFHADGDDGGGYGGSIVTALHTAVKRQNVAAVKVLLAAGASVRAKVKPLAVDGRNALHLVANNGNLTILALLLDALRAASSSNSTNSNNNDTPNNYSKSADLAGECPLFIADADGNTPAFVAASRGHSALFTQLIAAERNFFVFSSLRPPSSPATLPWTSVAGAIPLIRQHSSLRRTNKAGHTMLHAASFGCCDVTEAMDAHPTTPPTTTTTGEDWWGALAFQLDSLPARRGDDDGEDSSDDDECLHQQPFTPLQYAILAAVSLSGSASSNPHVLRRLTFVRTLLSYGASVNFSQFSSDARWVTALKRNISDRETRHAVGQLLLDAGADAETMVDLCEE